MDNPLGANTFCHASRADPRAPRNQTQRMNVMQSLEDEVLQNVGGLLGRRPSLTIQVPEAATSLTRPATVGEVASGDEPRGRYRADGALEGWQARHDQRVPGETSNGQRGYDAGHESRQDGRALPALGALQVPHAPPKGSSRSPSPRSHGYAKSAAGHSFRSNGYLELPPATPESPSSPSSPSSRSPRPTRLVSSRSSNPNNARRHSKDSTGVLPVPPLSRASSRESSGVIPIPPPRSRKASKEPTSPTGVLPGSFSKSPRLRRASKTAEELALRALGKRPSTSTPPPGAMKMESKSLPAVERRPSTPPCTNDGPGLQEFAMCFDLSRKHQLPLKTIRTMRQEFLAMDLNNDEVLSVEEFKNAISKRCNLGSSKPMVFDDFDENQNGTIDFEEYVLWYNKHYYAEEMVCPQPSQRNLRHIARKHGLPLPDVEQVKKVFDSFDTDGSGSIEEGEFKRVLIELVSKGKEVDISEKTFMRFWVEVDMDRSGEISLEEFVVWYFKIHKCGR